jgi:hypothetical protein
MDRRAILNWEARHIIEQAKHQRIVVRLIGGLAVHLRSPSASLPELRRDYADIDLVSDHKNGRYLGQFFSELNYQPNQMLNTLNGDRRQLYFREEEEIKVDIFIGDFEMCHKIPFASRMNLEPLTLPLAEIFLTKAQIVEMNRKDMLDLLALVIDHPVGMEDGETINGGIIATLCANDWGLFQTITQNCQRLRSALQNGAPVLSEEMTRIALARLETIQDAMQASQKTIAWKARSIIGTRIRWYEEVEEVQR